MNDNLNDAVLEHLDMDPEKVIRVCQAFLAFGFAAADHDGKPIPEETQEFLWDCAPLYPENARRLLDHWAKESMGGDTCK